MTRGVRWSLVGSLVLVALAGCGRVWFAEREPWRREAEVECLKSGAVKEGPTVRLLRPIEGPGICGADYPLKVSALGESPALAYVDEPLRPPGAIPQARIPASYPPAIAAPSYPAPAAASAPDGAAPYTPYTPSVYAPGPPPAAPSGPVSLAPPGAAPDAIDRRDGAYRETYPPAGQPEPVPLGPSRAPLTRASIPANVTPPATLACPLVSALDRWVGESVQPAAMRWFGSQVVEIRQISAYSCRGMNGQPGAHISEHAFGNALDVAAFTLADGRRITVKDGWHGLPEEQGFLHDVQLAACQQFSTVLAPGSNAFHYDHIHVDLMRRASGRVICEPGAIPGEVVAARLRGRYAGRRDGVSSTGSIASSRAGARTAYTASGGWERDRRPAALPGQD